MNINKLNVFIHLGEKSDPVGQLVLDRNEILFKYHPKFIETGFNLSPLKMDFNQEIQSGPKMPFEGLFGVFADSLPDAWGRLLLKKYLNKSGSSTESLTVLDRLAFTGKNSLGALEYLPDHSGTKTQERNIDLDYINNQVRNIIKGESSEIIDFLFEKGGSSGGARPKIYVNYNSTDDIISTNNDQLVKNEEAWIIKFAADVDATDIANIEYAYYQMALAAGIKMSECKLFKSSSGTHYFGTKRFDRNFNQKLHMISASGLFHDDFENSQLDYGILLNEGQKLSNNVKTQEEILRLAAFNLFAHNRDDHSKNFAFLMDDKGQWSFAPAYDLTFSSSSQGHHSTFYAGNSIDPGTKELMELIDHFSIRTGKEIIESVKESVSRWEEFAKISRVSNDSKNTINKTIQRLLKC